MFLCFLVDCSEEELNLKLFEMIQSAIMVTKLGKNLTNTSINETNVTEASSNSPTCNTDDCKTVTDIPDSNPESTSSQNKNKETNDEEPKNVDDPLGVSITISINKCTKINL